MARARIRTRDPARIPTDLPFEVGEVHQLDEEEFPDPEDPKVLMVRGPRDLERVMHAVRSRRRGERLLLKVSDPSLLSDQRIGALVEEAGDDLAAIDLDD